MKIKTCVIDKRGKSKFFEIESSIVSLTLSDGSVIDISESVIKGLHVIMDGRLSVFPTSSNSVFVIK